MVDQLEQEECSACDAVGTSDDSQQVSHPDNLNKAHQPILSFPKRLFGKQRRAFSSSWYKQYPWLHYQPGDDTVLCFYCYVAEKRSLLTKTPKDSVFSKTGFSNWKNALSKFEKHQCSVAHHEAVHLIQTIPRCWRNA